jgi:hypothetical protein
MKASELSFFTKLISFTNLHLHINTYFTRDNYQGLLIFLTFIFVVTTKHTLLYDVFFIVMFSLPSSDPELRKIEFKHSNLENDDNEKFLNRRLCPFRGRLPENRHLNGIFNSLKVQLTHSAQCLLF